MEGVELTQFADIYRGRSVLLTGHTGFKGSWLALWLSELGARVTGLSLAPPTSPNHWDLLNLPIAEHRLDIRDAGSTAKVLKEVRPEVVFHLAAQSLVRRSYRDPLETWATNVMGTASLLEACRQVPELRAIVVVTSDKCYENSEGGRAHSEADPLGGRDPYSASKAGAELIASSYAHAFFAKTDSPLVATARAGNVIGGGDWSEDRLLPDLVRAVAAGTRLEIRSPEAIRPWQHVLESLSGYLLLGQRLLMEESAFEGAWNFGPDERDECSVAEVLSRMRNYWPDLAWQIAKGLHPPEAQVLSLDSAKARGQLGWRPVWSLDAALRMTAQWYGRFLDDGSVDTRAQLRRYAADAHDAGMAWAEP